MEAMQSRGTCKVCKKPIAANETLVTFYGYGVDDGTEIPQTVHLTAMTHTGHCAEHYSEAEGEGDACREVKPLSAQPHEHSIIVNAQWHTVSAATLTYSDVCRLAGLRDAPGYSVVYSRGPKDKPDGILAPGRSVRVEDAMIFDAIGTGNA